MIGRYFCPSCCGASSLYSGTFITYENDRAMLTPGRYLICTNCALATSVDRNDRLEDLTLQLTLEEIEVPLVSGIDTIPMMLQTPTRLSGRRDS
jgi:hypothetical protein